MAKRKQYIGPPKLPGDDWNEVPLEPSDGMELADAIARKCQEFTRHHVLRGGLAQRFARGVQLAADVGLSIRDNSRMSQPQLDLLRKLDGDLTRLMAAQKGS